MTEMLRKRKRVRGRLGRLALGGTLFLSACGEPRTGPPPNVVFVVLDAARADHFSGYGYGKPTTPGIDDIARRGVVFLNNYVQATETFFSLPLIMSSRYYSKELFPKSEWRWGIQRESRESVFSDFDPEQTFLPEVLSRNGYRTAVIHDHWWFVPQTRFVRLFDEAFQVKADQPTDDAVLKTARAWIGKNRDKRFFLYLHIMSPHQPYPAKPEDRAFLGAWSQESIAEVVRKFETKPNESCQDWSPLDIECLNGLYDGNLRHSDERIKALYAFLEETGLAEDTLFIVSSDHGEHLGEHNHLNHGGPPFDGVIHVPLIMVWPQVLPAGVRVEGLTESIDIFPTIVDLCSLRIPEGKSLDGTSLVPSIRDPRKGKPAVYTDQSVRTDTYKYRFDEDGAILFNLKLDPGETTSICEDNPGLADSLRQRHETALSRSRDRHLSARRTSPPSHSFFIPSQEFDLKPPPIVERQNIHREPAGLARTFVPAKSWFLNGDDRYHGLFYFAGTAEAAAPLELSCPLPDGKYRISVLVESVGKPDGLPPGDAPFEARFEPKNPFRPPSSSTFPENSGCTYLSWGETEVTNNRFSIELRGRATAGTFFIHHIRFDPGAEGEKAPDFFNRDDSSGKRRDGLRSLGYL